MRNQKFKIAVVGATGLVGQQMMRILEQRGFPCSDFVGFASAQSKGQKIEFQSKEYEVQELSTSSFDAQGFDFVFFAGGGSVSAEYVPLAADAGAIAIDNSSHFRLEDSVPLIVPEVNPDDVSLAADSRIIANPNCSTAQLVMALKPLHDKANLKRVIVSTYQSVSGAGQAALEELRQQTSQLFGSQEITMKNFPHQIAFNCIPHIDVFYENGMTKEEMKMILETRKILSAPKLKVTATAVRVPVFIGHAESVNLEFEKPLAPDEARNLLANFPGIEVIDDPSDFRYPLQADCADQDEVFVGRIRQDESAENALHLWVVSDNLRKGAATNAIQIAELCVQRGLLKKAA